MNLTLFLPRNFSLAHWERVGLFDYSIDLYQRLAESGWRIGIVSYGGRSELDYTNRLPQFRILCNRWRLTPQAYERALPWLHWRWLRQTQIVKSYQVDGADNAYRTARLWKKPFVARCGYLLSDFAVRGGADARAVERARAVESLTFAAADRSVVTTPWMRDVIAHDYHVPVDRIRVIPNYVRTDRFSPDASGARPRRIVSVGRLEAQKNPLHLVEACAGLDVELVMIGMGSLQPAIRERARDLGVNLQLLGVRSHAELPSLLRQAALFVLPSSYEGHPKAIIEAMSCGLPVIAGDSRGVNDLISHGKTGWLCGVDPASIRASIAHLLDRPELRLELGRSARRLVVEQFSFDRVVELEQAMLGECTPN